MSLSRILKLAQTTNLQEIGDWKRYTSNQEIQRQLALALKELHADDKHRCQQAVEHYTGDTLAGLKCLRWSRTDLEGL